MANFLDAAYRVLSKERKPLSSWEIAKIAISNGWLISEGKTPWQTMKSKLSTNILTRKERSLFMRTTKGQFALREWADEDHTEYVADRYQKALLDEDILVFPAELLSQFIPGPGLHTVTLQQGKNLLDKCESMSRRLAELDYSVIQLVSVFVVKFDSFYLTYKRSKRLPEARLHGVYSVVFGGHLNPDDVPSLFNIFDVADGATFLSRELREELRFPPENTPTLTYRGLLYDDSRDISKQHLGIAYDVQLKSGKYEIGERGFLMDAKFESLDQIEARLDDFENWSCIVVRQEREYAQD